MKQSAIRNPQSAIPDPRVRGLHRALAGVEGRLRLREGVGFVPLAVSLGLVGTLALGVVGRLTPKVSLTTVAEAGAAMIVAAVLTVFAWAMLRPRDLLHTARRADQLLSLDERLSTALEDLGNAPANPTPAQVALREAQLDDALAAAERVDLRRDLPLRIEKRAGLYPAVLLAVLLAALFLPVPGLGPSDNDKAVARQVAAERSELQALKKAIQAQPATNDPAREQLNKELDNLLSDLQRDGLTREEALARLSQAESKLQKTLDPQAPAQREALDELAKQLSDSNDSSLKEAGDMLKSGDVKGASDALKKAGENATSMTPEERKQMAQSLRQAQQSVAPLDPELAQRLNEAANSLDSNDPKAAQKALDNLGQNINQTGQQLATQQQVEQALSQIQQSKGNIAQAGQPTPWAAALATAAAQGQGTPISGTPVSGTPLSGTALAQLQTQIAQASTAVANGTPVALGSPVKGQLSSTGTPVLMAGTPGQGTPVVAQAPGQPGQGQGQGQGSGQNGTQGGQGAQGAPGGGWGKGHTDPVYAPPTSLNAPSTVVPVQGQNNPNGQQSSTTTNTDANNIGPSEVPYEQVYGQYKDQAGRALNSDYIPQGYKDLVKDYFTSIEPEK